MRAGPHDHRSASTYPQYGGGIYVSQGKIILTDSIVSDNAATDGGGGISITLGTVMLTSSTVSGNLVTNRSGTGGGGILNNFGGTLTITNSTISGNAVWQQGGAIANLLGTVAIDASTIVGNNPGIYSDTMFGGFFYLRNSLLANTTANCAFNRFGSPPIGSADYNLSSDASCTGFTQPHDLNNVNPLIGPLANNGGPTQTHALLSGSPAIDRVPVTGAYCPATDQRGVARPQGAACDIGAFEGVLNPAPVVRPSDPTGPNGPPPPAPSPRTGIPPAGAVVNPPAPLPPHR